MTRFWVTTALTTIGLLAFIFALAWAIWGLQVATAGIYGRGEARIQIQSADFRIAAQATFFDQCAGIQGNEAQIDALNVTLAAEGISQRTRDFTITQLGGVTATRKAAIAKYNADSANTYLEGQFRDANLPFQLPLTDYPEGGPTTCTAAR